VKTLILAFVSSLFALVGFFLHGLVLPALQEDFKEAMQLLAECLIRRAVGHLPEQDREEMSEEWLAELAAVRGAMVFKLLFAARIWRRARFMTGPVEDIPP
jgi:hypothetical protein